MELFYVKPENVHETELILDDFERKHVVNTLRKTAGDSLTVTDGQGNLFMGEIVQTTPQVHVRILQKEKKEVPPSIALACGFIKQNRMDFILEKGTELGVQTFHFFRSHYANYFSANTTRLQKIVRQALKQSLHYFFPKIFLHPSLEAFFDHQLSSQTLKLIAIDSTYPSLRDLFEQNRWQASSGVMISVGPEGGFTKEEIERFKSNGYIGFSLGQHRLRAETAAIASIASIQQWIN